RRLGGQGFRPPPTPLLLTCCCHTFCFLGLPFQSWVAQELALFRGCRENCWGGGIHCFVRPVLTPSPLFTPTSQE
uniref:Uncharacterized protein n=1 Tax=Phocoena sinus TaxID=42100 RepID=A0A8C9EG22_PHOSS